MLAVRASCSLRPRSGRHSRFFSAQLAMLDDFIEKEIAVAPAQGDRIVMINIPVNDLQATRRFYEELLQIEFVEEQHDDGPLHLNATFGEWNTPSWFLLALWRDTDRAGSTDVGFLVENLDQAYERALAAGATDVSSPRAIPGMPRTAQLIDPSGNQVGLYQA